MQESSFATFVFDAPQSPTGQAFVIVDLTDDPRRDLGMGAPLWHDLLARAAALDSHDPHGLFGILHGLRCAGATLTMRPSGGVRISAGEMPEGDYAYLRQKYLEPHAEALGKLLAAVRL